MSESPPPIVPDDEKTTSTNTANIEIDLENSSTDNLNASASAEKNKQTLNDDLFFSTISDPETTSKKNIEDMDEIFKMNSPSPSTNHLASNTKEIKLTDDEEEDPFSLNDNNSKKSVSSSNNQPTLTNSQPASLSIDNAKSNDDSTSFKKSVCLYNYIFNLNVLLYL
jgi:hypothetical protein